MTAWQRPKSTFTDIHKVTILIAASISELQRRTQNLVKHLRKSLLQIRKQFLAVNLCPQNAPS